MAAKERIRLAMLRGVARFYPPPSSPPPLEELSRARILLIRPDHLGDVLFATPVLRLLREALPKAHITCLVGPWSKAVLKDNPFLDRILTMPFPGFTRRPKGFLLSPYLLLWREAKRLEQEGFQVAINLRFDFWWGAMLSYLARIPLRLGYDVPECLPFLSQALPYQPGLHQVEQNRRLVTALVGQEASCPANLAFPIPPQDEAFVQERLAAWPGTGPLVVLHPGSGAPVKLWTAQGFARVAEHLSTRHGARLIITGGPGEESLVRAVSHAAQCPTEIFMGSLGQVAALLRRSALAIGVDSGIMHLAVAVSTPTVHLYGPVGVGSFGPWGPQEKHPVVTADRECIPCNKLDYSPRHLAQHPCVRDIQPSQVIEAADRLLAPVAFRGSLPLAQQHGARA